MSSSPPPPARAGGLGAAGDAPSPPRRAAVLRRRFCTDDAPLFLLGPVVPSPGSARRTRRCAGAQGHDARSPVGLARHFHPRFHRLLLSSRPGAARHELLRLAHDLEPAEDDIERGHLAEGAGQHLTLQNCALRRPKNTWTNENSQGQCFTQPAEPIGWPRPFDFLTSTALAASHWSRQPNVRVT